MKYKSKIAWWMYLTLAVCFLPVLILSATETDWKQLIIAFLILGGVCMFIIYLMRSTFYTIKKGILEVKAGVLINQKIPILEIKRIKETNNPLSAPAMSLDRLQIQSNKTSTLISPALKQEFINHLLKINPEIEVEYKKN